MVILSSRGQQFFFPAFNRKSTMSYFNLCKRKSHQMIKNIRVRLVATVNIGISKLESIRSVEIWTKVGDRSVSLTL